MPVYAYRITNHVTKKDFQNSDFIYVVIIIIKSMKKIRMGHVKYDIALYFIGLTSLLLTIGLSWLDTFSGFFFRYSENDIKCEDPLDENVFKWIPPKT